MRAWGEGHANGIWLNVALAIPPTAFVVFMLWDMKTNNCLHKIWQGESAAFNVLSLVTRFGMLLLELSVVAFLLQGNRVRGLAALLPAIVLSSIIAAIVAAIKVIFIFGFDIPLFIDGNDIGDWRKWSFWLAHKLLLVALYAFILCLPHTKWQNKVPAKPTFYNYIRVLFLLNTTSALGCFLLLSGVAFGYWIYDFTNICYHAFYAPLLYATFLREFFQEEDLHLEDVYYSEMKDAGFFDADWE